ncbi:hypothetical protein [Halosolutus gelatinilyticus]|uniref:hypothetical protein n=1 Tax=Halosolutus gelatinilyticus TaxID=2931975 RepID=UPI001FF29F24|nr:hypothetical protein [Halosolutus gelatinilyticus]
MTDAPSRDAAETSTDSRAEFDSLADPEHLRGCDGVRYQETTRVHGDEDYCMADKDGAAAVGVMTADGRVLLATHREESVALLPNAHVESGGDWVAAGYRAVERIVDVPIAIERPVLVRSIEHAVQGRDELHTTSHTVVFEASPRSAARAADLPSGGTCTWDGGWFESFPESGRDTPTAPAADVRLFLD